MSDLKTVVERLQDVFPDAIEDVVEFRDEVTLRITRDSIVEVAEFCRDTDGLEFNWLSDLAGIDYYPESPRFAVSYVIFSMIHGFTLRLKVYVSEDDPTIPSITDVYPAGNWQEREVYDMFGVTFDGHPDMRRILMPFDWTGHPQRKDYPLGYEEVQFSFNFERVQRQKPHPQE